MPHFKWTSTVLLILSVIACVSSEGIGKGNSPKKSQGAKSNMKKCPLGRYSLSVPVEMSLDAHSTLIREIEITEFKWPDDVDKESYRVMIWNQNLTAIRNLRKPDGIKDIVIAERSTSTTDQWSKAVYYYGNHSQNDEGFWDILIDAGVTGVWLRFDGMIHCQEEMLQLVLEVARAYQPLKPETILDNPTQNSFYLKYGAINIPYKHQESTYARFEGHPLSLKLEIEMTDTQVDEPENEGLLARTAAIIATGYATGVDIRRLRSKKRNVAGLAGEEEVDRMTDSNRTAISFGWRYAGKKDSGEYPEIVIHMESPDGDLKEKLKIWDAILDSMKPLYKN